MLHGDARVQAAKGNGVPVKVRELIRESERDGWVQVDQAGSHRHFEHPDKSGKVTVAGKPNASLKPKTGPAYAKMPDSRNAS